ncbi:MAG: hypothetical protein Kow00121_38810 [Elainellaceae cyanobacterium]
MALRVLLLAEDCNPDWPSLPVVAYKFARAISNYADVVVATQVRNKPNIDRDGLGNAEVIYLDTERIAAPIYKLAQVLRGGHTVSWTVQMAMNYPSYLAFEQYVWRRFKQDIYQGKFDLVHRITPMSPTLPSPIAKFSPIPFVLGPLNGNLPWPKPFQAEQKREREWLSNVRNAYKYLPYYRDTYQRAACVLGAFAHTIADLPKSVAPKTINYPEVGIDPALFSPPDRPVSEQMTILFAGRLVPYKLPEVVVRAFATSPLLRQHKLVIVGEGPERPRLEQIIAEANLGNSIKLLGNISQAEVGQIMRRSEIFAFPSIRELGAGVVVEAMACGMASVVVDYGAPATLIDSDRGVKVPMGNIDALVASYQTQLEQLVTDPERVKQLGEAAYHHAMQHYTWDVKAQKMLEIYRWVLKQQDTQPNFWKQETRSSSILV